MSAIKLNTSSSQPIIEDARVVTPGRRFIRRCGIFLGSLLVAVAIAGAWLANNFYLEPKRDELVVAEALKSYDSEWNKYIKSLAEAERLALIYQEMKPTGVKVDDGKRMSEYLAALRMARRAGIPEARLDYGKALRDGLMGKRDSAAALKIFDGVSQEIEAGVRAGDPVAMYVAAKILKEGLGKQPDKDAAFELAKRAAPNLDGWRLEALGDDLVGRKEEGIFSGDWDSELANKIVLRLFERKSNAGVRIASLSCRQDNNLERGNCRKNWYRQASYAGVPGADLRLASANLSDGDSLDEIANLYSRVDLSNEPFDQFNYAVVRAITADHDNSLYNALVDLWKFSQILDGSGSRNWEEELNRKMKWSVFGGYINSLSPKRLDNFFIAMNVYIALVRRTRGINYGYSALLFENIASGLVIRGASSEIMNKSLLIANSIHAEIPVTKIVWESSPHNENVGRNPTGRLNISKAPVSDGPSAAKAKDSEQQNHTGYLNGAPRLATGGISTFTVDNRQGDKDAVARIYLNGGKRAVRSVYVKQGEVFKMVSLSPGTYVFRYRFIGSEDTFEADRNFSLLQSETETGIRYSNINVTLFSVRDGNMSTKKVDPSKF